MVSEILSDKKKQKPNKNFSQVAVLSFGDRITNFNKKGKIMLFKIRIQNSMCFKCKFEPYSNQFYFYKIQAIC